jgi:uncharacterized protein YxeA
MYILMQQSVTALLYILLTIPVASRILALSLLSNFNKTIQITNKGKKKSNRNYQHSKRNENKFTELTVDANAQARTHTHTK